MRTVSLRPLLAAMALVMALTGAITLAVFSGGEMPAGATNEWIIRINEEGFNPRFCSIVRDDTIAFENVGSTTVRVFKPNNTGVPADPDWTLAPGELSGALKITYGGNTVFHSSTGYTVTVFSPNNSTGTPGCFKEAPTPTPTPTFTATPIRTATSTATPTPQRPANCTWNGCAVSVGVASDGE
jgi:hypothetical protein